MSYFTLCDECASQDFNEDGMFCRCGQTETMRFEDTECEYFVSKEQLLNEKLKDFPDAYSSFVDGTMSYVRKKPSRLETILNFIENNENLTCSDVVKFIMEQPDFHE